MKSSSVQSDGPIIRISGEKGERKASASERVAQSKSGFGSFLSALGGDRLRKAGLTGMAALMFGAIAVPGPAVADYVRIDGDEAQVVEQMDVKPAVIPSDSIGEAQFDPGRLEEYPLFQRFWSSDLEGTSQQGVWALSPLGVKHLLEYAGSHTLDGQPLASASDPSGPIAISEGHQALIEHLLGHSYYTAFISQDATPILRAAFDLPEVAVREAPQHEPVDGGEVRVCSKQEWWGTDFSNWRIRDMPRALGEEFRLGVNAGRYDAPGLSLDEKQYELTCLLHQFGQSLNQWDDLALPPEDQVKHQIQDQLLESFFNLPVFQSGDEGRQLRAYFARDFNGSGMGLAQSIVKGFDPNSFPVEFPNASGRGSPVSLSMSTGNLAGAMATLDEMRVAAGLEPSAVERKNLPSLGYMVGTPSGHDKISFDERSPPIDRLDYGRMIQVGSAAEGFRSDPRLSELPPKAGFTFPIDGVSATGAAVVASSGTKLQIYREADRARLDVGVVIHSNDEGQAESWSLEFKDARGEIVPPNEVVGLLERHGRVLGDGHADQKLNTGYWGMCDDNTGSDVIFARFSALPEQFAPQREGESRLFVRTGDTLTPISLQHARELVYMDLPGIGSTETPANAGYRFGEDPSVIHWQRGNTIHTNYGLLEGFTPSPFTQPHHEFVQGDTIRIQNRADAPLLGTLRLESASGSVRMVPAQDVTSIVQHPDGQITAYYRSGSSTSKAQGTPLTDLGGLDWSQAELSMDPSTQTPGRSDRLGEVEPGATLQSMFPNPAAELGVALPDILRANPDILARPAGTVEAGETLVVPAGEIAVASQGEAVRALLDRIAGQTGLSRTQLERANREAIAAVAVEMEQEGENVSTIPEGTELTLVTPEHEVMVPSSEDGPRFFTLDEAHAALDVSRSGVTADQLHDTNPHVAERPAGWVKQGDKINIPERFLSFSADQPFKGDFFMRRTDGVDITVRADEVRYIEGETPHDVRFTHYLRFVQQSKGVYGNEGSLTRSISNGRRWVDNIALYQTQGADRPDWIRGDDRLAGIDGPLVRQPGDKMVFAAGTANGSNTFSGWYQVDQQSGRVLNEGFINGEPDFLWGIHDSGLNWNARSTYIGDAMTPEFRLGIIVNGIEALRTQTDDAERIAEELDLPFNWQRYIVTDEEIDAHLATQEPAPEPNDG